MINNFTGILTRLSEFIDFLLASVLLTVLLMLTNKKWRGIKDLLLIIVGASLTGYLCSSALRYMFPEIYGISEQIGNSIASVGMFLLLLTIVEKDYWMMAKEMIQEKLKEKLKDVLFPNLPKDE